MLAFLESSQHSIVLQRLFFLKRKNLGQNPPFLGRDITWKSTERNKASPNLSGKMKYDFL